MNTKIFIAGLNRRVGLGNRLTYHCTLPFNRKRFKNTFIPYRNLQYKSHLLQSFVSTSPIKFKQESIHNSYLADKFTFIFGPGINSIFLHDFLKY